VEGQKTNALKIIRNVEKLRYRCFPISKRALLLKVTVLLQFLDENEFGAMVG
jgi:hypothetical protein